MGEVLKKAHFPQIVPPIVKNRQITPVNSLIPLYFRNLRMPLVIIKSRTLPQRLRNRTYLPPSP